MGTGAFASKKRTLNLLNKLVTLGDVYYEVYFSYGNSVFMSPTICTKNHCTIVDNIISNLFINK
jgi:hypothetical protein